MIFTQLLHTYKDFERALLEESTLYERQQASMSTAVIADNEDQTRKTKEQKRRQTLRMLRIFPHCIQSEPGSRIHPYLLPQQLHTHGNLHQHDHDADSSIQTLSGNATLNVTMTLPHYEAHDFSGIVENATALWKSLNVEEVFLCGMSLNGMLSLRCYWPFSLNLYFVLSWRVQSSRASTLNQKQSVKFIMSRLYSVKI